MYSREFDGETLRFETSGGLISSSLVVQDKETDSYWSIMKGESIGGEYEGTQLEELPVTRKLRWSEWRALHPETLVLSVDGYEDIPVSPYESYLHSAEGFRGATAEDQRLETKQGIFAFRLNGKAYAAPFFSLSRGRIFPIDDIRIFLFRVDDSSLYESTSAFKITEGTLEKLGEKWTHTASGAVFEPTLRAWSDEFRGLEPLAGFDTFWYTWSPFHPNTLILQ